MPFAYSLDKVGVLARSAADGAAALRALVKERHKPALRAHGEAPRDLRGLRIGLVEQRLGFALDPTIQIYYDGAIASLEGLGASVGGVKLPELPYGDIAEVVAEAEAFDAFSDLIEARRLGELDDPVHRGVAEPNGPLATDYVRAMRLRTALSAQLRQLFAEHDVLLSLNSPILPPRLDVPLPAHGGDAMRLAGNLAGLPAVAVPMGFAPPGRLPVSFQLVGRPYSDERLLSIAAAYQRVSGWHLERPAEA
jgi:aspartyl-tRNA(Asn)/glutamyl-tRNA(Gln) amidotransferase subunit A